MKVCIKCAAQKELEDYPPDKRNADGREGQCRTCRTAANAQRRYGLTLDEHKEMIEESPDCNICKVPFNSIPTKSCHVDHEHSTGVVRGVLCRSCNIGLGHFDDDTNRLEAAKDYLEKHRMKKTQANTVLDYLSDRGRITQIVASGFGVSRLAAVVEKINREAKRQVISVEYKKGHNCTRYAEYTLAEAA